MAMTCAHTMYVCALCKEPLIGTPEAGAMTEQRAREILTDRIQPDGGLYDGAYYIAWKPGEPDACLDCTFTADELEAIAWWMRQRSKPQKGSA